MDAIKEQVDKTPEQKDMAWYYTTSI